MPYVCVYVREPKIIAEHDARTRRIPCRVEFMRYVFLGVQWKMKGSHPRCLAYCRHYSFKETRGIFHTFRINRVILGRDSRISKCFLTDKCLVFFFLLPNHSSPFRFPIERRSCSLTRPYMKTFDPLHQKAAQLLLRMVLRIGNCLLTFVRGTTYKRDALIRSEIRAI